MSLTTLWKRKARTPLPNVVEVHWIIHEFSIPNSSDHSTTIAAHRAACDIIGHYDQIAKVTFVKWFLYDRNDNNCAACEALHRAQHKIK